MKIVIVAGARPNFMKVAPLVHEFKRKGIEYVLVHTGQHYDANMSQVFFDELGIPKPDVNLAVGSKARVEQIREMKQGLVSVLKNEKIDGCVVVGDANSSFGGALAAFDHNVPLAHVEAGLRSYNQLMPEELNRIEVDSMADILLTTEATADRNLISEGVDEKKIQMTGNVMIDSLENQRAKFEKLETYKELGLEKGEYAVFTAHRFENIESKTNLHKILDTLEHVQKKVPVLWPIHPHTRKNIETSGWRDWLGIMKNVKIVDPLGYRDFMNLMVNAMMVITDSGGLQEETTVLNIPCITIRTETERPITVEIGTNVIAGLETGNVMREVNKIVGGNAKQGSIPPMWDGKAAARIVNAMEERL